ICSLPTLFYQVNEAVNDPECSFSEIARIISADTALCARLLKIVNSPFYGFPSQVETISHAIAIVGTSQLRDLVLATTILSKFKGLSVELVNMESFWRHSIACGLAARIIATFRRESNPDRFYVIGLLHDIGRLIVYQNIPEQAKEVFDVAQSKERLVHEVEREVLGFDHADVGKKLLEIWKLPPGLAEAVGNHHNPAQSFGYPLESAVVHAANIIVTAMQLGNSGERFVPPLNPKTLEWLDFLVAKMREVMDQVDLQFEATVEMFLIEE
ncbi:MAG: HDOD domain-containing protein, partial [Nitrospinales bacterium]